MDEGLRSVDGGGLSLQRVAQPLNHVSRHVPASLLALGTASVSTLANPFDDVNHDTARLCREADANPLFAQLGRVLVHFGCVHL